MRMGMIAMMIALVGLNFSIVGCTQNASERRAASPTIAERLKQDSVTGLISGNVLTTGKMLRDSMRFRPLYR